MTPAFALVAEFVFLVLPAPPTEERMMVPPAPLLPEERQMVLPTRPGEVKPPEPEGVVKLIRVRGVDAKKLVRPLQTIYGSKPGFKIYVLEEPNYLIVRGDQQTIEDIIEIVRLLE